MKDKMEITYKEFFKKAKSHPKMQKLIIQCLVTATKMVCRLQRQDIDIGDLALTSLSTMTEAFSGIKLINKEEITAEYMAGIIDLYSKSKEWPEVKK